MKKSFDLAISIIKLNKSLRLDQSEFVMSRQVLKSGTAVDALIREAQNAESKADFVHKLAIAQKECSETLYWLELLVKSEYIEPPLYNDTHALCTEVLKMVRSAIITTKQRYLKS